MLIHGIAYKEVAEFISGLTDAETKYYDINKELESLKSAALLNGFKVNGQLVGIGGINKYYGIIPHTFYMIKSEYQEQGIGSIFSKENMKYAANKLPFIITIIEDGNMKARKIAEHRGFKFVTRRLSHSYYYKYFNKFGKFIGFFFPYIISVYYVVNGRR